MIEKTKINEIIKRIADKFNPERIILFGSYANDSAKEDSDLDLVVIQESNLPKHKRSFSIYKVLQGTKVPIDILVYTRTEFEDEIKQPYSFLNSAIKSSKVVYERA